jgi:hypothetical protein
VPETDELWGGSLTSVSFDPVAWTLQFGVEVVEGEESRRYNLTLDGVVEWSVTRDVPLPWTYAELTEVQVTELEDNHVFVEMVLWNDDTSLMARCARVQVDRLA